MIVATNFTVLVGLFILFALSRAYLRYRSNDMSLRQFLFWAGVWITAAAVIFYPQNTDRIAAEFGVSRGSDIVVYVSIIILFYLSFRIYAAIGSLQHEITRLVRALALDAASKDAPDQIKSKS